MEHVKDIDLIRSGKFTHRLVIGINAALTLCAFGMGCAFATYLADKPLETKHFIHLGVVILLWLACLYYQWKALQCNIEVMEMYQESSHKYSELLDGALENSKKLVNIINAIGEKEDDKAGM